MTDDTSVRTITGKNTGTIRVVLVDDHDLVRAGLEQLLGSTPDITVVATGSDGAQAVDLVDSYAPDVVLMDLSMPEVDGIEATRRLADSDARARVLILTTFELDEYVYSAMKAALVSLTKSLALELGDRRIDAHDQARLARSGPMLPAHTSIWFGDGSA